MANYSPLTKIMMDESGNSKNYPKKWFDQSNQSTSWMTKFNGPISRTIQFVVGILTIIIYNIYF